MGLKEEVIEMQKELEEVKHESFALEILNDYKKQTKRLFVIICILITIIFLFVGGLVYVITSYDFTYEETIQEVDTGNGNACIGDNCGNGDING